MKKNKSRNNQAIETGKFKRARIWISKYITWTHTHTHTHQQFLCYVNFGCNLWLCRWTKLWERLMSIVSYLSFHANCLFTFDKLTLRSQSAWGIIGKIYAHAVIIGYCNDNVVYSDYTMWWDCSRLVHVQTALFVIEANICALSFIRDSTLFKLTVT
jgi:hypothetical protein